ncbi:MAG: MFS transporter [Actinomycetota bacterium]
MTETASPTPPADDPPDETADSTGSADSAGDAPVAARPPNALRVPAFRQLWINNALYMLVLNAQRFTFGWFVLDGLGRNEVWQGAVTFALGIPVALLILPAGAWADRYDRKMLLVVGQVGTMVVLALTAALVAADVMTLWLLLVLAVAFGVVQTVGHPVRSSLIPALVSPEQLFSAIAANAIAITLSMVLGPVVFQLIGDALGFGGAFISQSALLAVGLLALIPLAVPPTERQQHPDTAPADTRGELAEAFAHIRANPQVAKLFALLSVAALTVNPAIMVTLQARVAQELERDGGDAAPLLALLGFGMAITSSIIMRRGNMARKGALFQRAMMVGSTMVMLMGLAPTYALLFPLNFVMGLAGGFYINMNQGLIQSNTPEHLMGRVMAMLSLVQFGLLPVGALLLGVVGSLIGLGNTITLAGAVALTCVVYTYTTDERLRSL